MWRLSSNAIKAQPLVFGKYVNSSRWSSLCIYYNRSVQALTAIPLSFSTKRRFHFCTQCIIRAPRFDPEKHRSSLLSRNCSPEPILGSLQFHLTINYFVHQKLSVLERNVDVCRIWSNRCDFVPRTCHYLEFAEYLDWHRFKRCTFHSSGNGRSPFLFRTITSEKQTMRMEQRQE